MAGGAFNGMKIKIVNAEALVIGPEDRLLIRIPETLPEGLSEAITGELLEHFKLTGLAERVLILQGEFELTKVEPREP